MKEMRKVVINNHYVYLNIEYLLSLKAIKDGDENFIELPKIMIEVKPECQKETEFLEFFQETFVNSSIGPVYPYKMIYYYYQQQGRTGYTLKEFHDIMIKCSFLKKYIIKRGQRHEGKLYRSLHVKGFILKGK